MRFNKAFCLSFFLAALVSFGIASYIPVTSKSVRSGTISVALLETNKMVTFSTAMPSVNYQIFFQPVANVSAVFLVSGKTTTNCTLNISASISGTISYLAVED